MIREGNAAPDFTLRSDAGENITLSRLRGRPVVLYFYPKDDTPGCTKQSCSFRDAYGEEAPLLAEMPQRVAGIRR